MNERALYRRGGFWASEGDVLMYLGQSARLQGQGGLARALLDEALTHFPDDCSIRQFVHANDSLAMLEELRVEKQRRVRPSARRSSAATSGPSPRP